MKRILFVCSQNKLRSPTVERIFSDYGGFIVASAGMASDAENKLNADHVAGADMIFVMEKEQEELLKRKYKRYLKNTTVVCLDIPDHYNLMDPELIKILRERVPKYLHKLQQG